MANHMVKPLRSSTKKVTFGTKLKYSFKHQKLFYFLALPAIIYYLIFHYLPFYGLQIAFKDYSTFKGIWDSVWVGLDNFKYIFSGSGKFMFLRALKNTLLINAYSLIFAFPIPIILALLFNEIRNNLFRKVSQTVLYLPHFISELVVAGLVINLLSPDTGVINNILMSLHIIDEPIYFMIMPEYYRFIYIASGVWKNAGFDSIIYFAALLGISPSLYEAAKVDGANKFHVITNITLPGISSTIIIMFILRVGKLLSIGFEKTILLYQPQTYEVADVLGSYIYRIGLQGANQLDVATAAGLFESVVAVILVYISNRISKKIGGTSLW
ncbi:ABC transporter permease [Vallitalea okinawensis]|uniref:ABC transporter permease n=1 Tax=Vallitalea okinawensis TaxID=2078660 RepID=UPI001FA905CF|nr:ABC transporter permease subunit [Vallitalea okinawensis]